MSPRPTYVRNLHYLSFNMQSSIMEQKKLQNQFVHIFCDAIKRLYYQSTVKYGKETRRPLLRPEKDIEQFA
jgi:hypothetical protein